jgi:phosphoheptose isomerase
MKTGFLPISLKEYVEIHQKSNPGTNREEITTALRDTLNAYKNGAKCLNCGKPI